MTRVLSEYLKERDDFFSITLWAVILMNALKLFEDFLVGQLWFSSDKDSNSKNKRRNVFNALWFGRS